MQRQEPGALHPSPVRSDTPSPVASHVGAAVNIAKTSNLSPPLLLDADNNEIRSSPMYPLEAMEKLSAAYASEPASHRRPGIISAACTTADPSVPLDPRVQLAIENELKYRSRSVPRDVLERAAYGAAKSNFPYNRTPEVRANRDRNGYPRHTYQLDEELAMEIAGGLIGSKDIKQGDRIVDVGSGPGHFAKALDDFGMDVTAVEMDLDPDSAVFEHTIRSSIEAFADQCDTKFSVAVSNHFSPCGLGASDEEVAAAAKKYVAAVARCIEPGRHYLCGISTKDPEYVSPGHALDMKAILKAQFEKVELHWADEYGPEFAKFGSLGGMVAVYKCSGESPQRKASREAAERLAAAR